MSPLHLFTHPHTEGPILTRLPGGTADTAATTAAHLPLASLHAREDVQANVESRQQVLSLFSQNKKKKKSRGREASVSIEGTLTRCLLRRLERPHTYLVDQLLHAVCTASAKVLR
jgi:hypothetical protein